MTQGIIFNSIFVMLDNAKIAAETSFNSQIMVLNKINVMGEQSMKNNFEEFHF